MKTTPTMKTVAMVRAEPTSTRTAAITSLRLC